MLEGEQPNLERLARKTRPSEDFMQLCAAQGQARFSINGELVEGISYALPGITQGIIVTLRQSEIQTTLASQTESSALTTPAIKIITEFGQTIASSLDFP